MGILWPLVRGLYSEHRSWSYALHPGGFRWMSWFRSAVSLFEARDKDKVMSMQVGRPHAEALGDAPRERIWGSRLGWLTGVDDNGRFLVDFGGNTEGPLPAKRTINLTSEAVRAAVATRQFAVLLFEDGDPRLPLVIGLEQGHSSTPLLDVMLDTAGIEPEPVPAPTEARVDGQRVEIEGKDEIVLRCGQASITMRSNGKVVIRGVYVETQSSGVNRIKGGSVQVN